MNLHTETAATVLRTPDRCVMLSQQPLSAVDIDKLANHPYRTCPTCEGECIMGVALALTSEGILMIPMPCPDCDGAGQIMYISNS